MDIPDKASGAAMPCADVDKQQAWEAGGDASRIASPPQAGSLVSLPPEFQTPTAFAQAFELGLARMIDAHHDLGVFILVLANAVMDARLHARLHAALDARFAQLCADPPSATADDEAVFRALRGIGWDKLGAVRGRALDDLEIQLNPLRGLRPPRNAGATIETLQRDFDPDGFHFAKPFLRKEIFWNGALMGRDAALLYNKFPFLPWHGLLVPELHEGHAQYLSADWHAYVFELCAQLGVSLPGVGFGYNAYGANASVNHLHFQMFVREQGLPVAHPHWRHNGGNVPYPARCLRFDDVDQAWEVLSGFHAANQTYNLVYLPGRVYCLPRHFQGTHAHADWNEGYAFYEMAGGLTVFDPRLFDRLNASDLGGELARLTV